jgi:DNA polymerase theta
LSTKAEVLQELTAQHPLPGIILEYRKLSKLLSGFLAMLLDKARQSALVGNGWAGGAGSGGGSGSSRCGGSGGRMAAVMSGLNAGILPPGLVRIRGEFMQTNTATGRLSMEEPSLQTIPKPVVYERRLSDGSMIAAGVLETGAEGQGDVGGDGHGGIVVREVSNLRAAFVAPPGWVLISADYCQIELRMMAHFSGDAVLLKTLAAGDKDPFKQLAAEWLGGKVEEVSWKERCSFKDRVAMLLK